MSQVMMLIIMFEFRFYLIKFNSTKNFITRKYKLQSQHSKEKFRWHINLIYVQTMYYVQIIQNINFIYVQNINYVIK